VGEAIWAVAGMVVGLLTAVFFERRALAASRAEAAELRRELDALKAGILTIGGGSVGPRARNEAVGSTDKMFQWLREHQNAAGRIRIDHVMTRFMGEWSKVGVDNTLDQLNADGLIAVEGEWIRIR